MKQAIILLSGGLDSATVAALAKDQGFELIALSFAYGQKHSVELKQAQAVADFFKINEHKIINLETGVFLNSALTDKLAVPDYNPQETSNIPTTYVPARNIIFLSYATALAESHTVTDIFIGANAVDYSGYPDCRPEFITAFQEMINIGTKIGLEQQLKIHTPLINLSKADIIKKGLELGVDYSITHSCYNPDENGIACGVCDSCYYRQKGFAENNISDPIKYQNN